jgi:hypothetical protein
VPRSRALVTLKSQGDTKQKIPIGIDAGLLPSVAILPHPPIACGSILEQFSFRLCSPTRFADHDPGGHPILNVPVVEVEQPATQRSTIGIRNMRRQGGLRSDFDEQLHTPR